MENLSAQNIEKTFIDIVSEDGNISYSTMIKVANILVTKLSFIEVILPGGVNEILQNIINDSLDKIDKNTLSEVKSFTQRVIDASCFFLDATYSQNPIFFSKFAKYCLKNPHFGIKMLYKISSDIIKLAGDASLDFSYYTKRGILFSIYASIMLDIVQKKDIDIIKRKLTNRINKTKQIPTIKTNLFKRFIK